MNTRGTVNRASRTTVLLVVSGLVVAAIAACSDSPVQGPSGRSVTIAGASGHAIHAFAVRPDGSRHPMSFGPGTEIGTASGGGAVTASNTFQNITSSTFDGGVQLQAAPTIGNASQRTIDNTAWALLERASIYCSQIGSPGNTTGQLGDVPWQLLGQNFWFIYQSLPDQCSGRLQTEENLLCVADQLGAVADAVGTTVWPALPSAANCTPYDYESATDAAAYSYSGQGCSDASDEWDIPPQATADQFIVRDLAIHTLGILATLDATPIDSCPTASGGTSPCTCTSLLGEIAEVGATGSPTSTPVSPFPIVIGPNDTTNSDIAFGVPATGCPTAGTTGSGCFPAYPPSNVPVYDPIASKSNAPTIARSSLQIESQIMRAGGRLLHDLVRRDVYADLASAAQQASQALDPSQGNLIAWGQDATVGPYGTYAHAARVLAGRWEIGDAPSDFNGHGDPQCGGSLALNILQPSVYGSDLSARVQDAPIRTSGQALAAQLVGEAGIVLPSCSTTDGTILQGVLASQLQTELEARNRGATIPLATFTQTVGSLQPSDVLFGFAYALHTYELLTNTPDLSANGGPCSALPIAPGLPAAVANATSPSVTASNVGGIVIAGGIDRSRLKTDPIARAGGILSASECPENVDGIWNEWGSSTVAYNPALSAPLPKSVFQDAFHIGQALERRLVEAEVAASPVQGSDSGDPESVARGGVAELRSWAGSMVVQAWGSGGPVGGLSVRIAGDDYSNLGVTAATPAALRQSSVAAAFGFVYGPAWAAECAVHVRTDCPTNFDTTWVQHATSVVDNEDLNPAIDYTDIDGAITPVFTLNVPFFNSDAGRVANFRPAPQAGALPNSHLYVVRLTVPSNPLGQGAVLGAIAPQLAVNPASSAIELSSNIVDFVVAPMQRELLDDTIDLGKWVGARPPTVGDLTAADSPGYCVDGVSRDVFVPLQNQLTEGATGGNVEQSWQYYLNIAQTAAATADALGQQLLNLDLQTTQNEQAAGEAVAGLCGDYGALSETTVTASGQVIPKAGDKTLSACLTTDNTDIVFLGPIPASLTASATPNVWLQHNVLGCASTGSTDPNCSTALSSPLKYASLGLAQSQPASSVTQACSQLPAILASKGTSFAGSTFRGVVGDPLFGSSSLAGLTAALRMNVDLWDNWQVTYAGTPIMDSQSTTLWPGCLHASTCSTSATDMPYLLNTAFRYCPNATDPMTLLTTKLGCDPGTGDNVAAELNILKWRVAGGLWMLAASAGVMPASMFNIPVPVVLLPTSDGQGGSQNTFVAAGYNGQQFVSATQATMTGMTTLQGYTVPAVQGVASSADVTDLGTVYDIPSAWTAAAGSAVNEVPGWYLDLYTSATVAFTKQAQTSNASLVWPNCTTAAALGISSQGCGVTSGVAMPNATVLPQPILIAQILDAGAWTLDGLTCAGPTGFPSQVSPGATTPAGPSGVEFVDLVTALKTDYDISPFKNVNPATTAGAVLGQGCEGAPGSMTCRDDSDGNLITTFGPTLLAFPLWWATPVPEQGTNSSGQGTFTPPTTGLAANPAWRTSAMPPWQRVFAFTNLSVENGPCNALSQLLSAATIACASQAQGNSGVATTTPPPVNTVSDIGAMAAWLSMMSGVAQSSVQYLYAEEIPTRVVADFQNGQVGKGDKSGTYGTDVLAIEQSMQDLPGAWTRIGTDFTQIQNAISAAGQAINAANLGEDDAMTAIALNQIRVQGEMAQASIGFLSSIASAAGSLFTCETGTGAMQCGSAITSFMNVAVAGGELNQSLSTGNQELAAYNTQMGQAQQAEELQVAQALTTMSSVTAALWADVQNSLDNIRKDVAAIDTATSDLQATQNKASYEAAIATGADSVMIAGQEVAIPVNTVLNRQASATEIRYQNALTNAKALAYMARRAIEQRIGFPLSALTSPVGPLDPPATWADDVCSLSGINYAVLSTPTTADAGGQGGAADQAVITQFANQFVGDYVSKLSEFVTYFNVQYPSHEGNDAAVLSLRYDLMNPVPECLAPAANLLFESGRLDDLLDPTALTLPPQGWTLGACPAGSSTCLAVVPGSVLPSPAGPAGAQQAAAQVSGVVSLSGDTGLTWLADIPASATESGGTGNSDGGVDGGATVGPENVVYQAVPVSAGTYILSWWDQARNSSGALASSAEAIPYMVRVFDPTWRQVASYNNDPYVANSANGSAWSSRLSLSFTVGSSGTYYVAFGASSGAGSPGSVAIADVQLEVSTGNGLPSSYVETGNSTTTTMYDCPPSDSDMRGAFRHSCDQSGTCWYDLSTPIIIDTQQLQNGTAAVSSKLAPGNYNFRHVDLAVNLVGTNVHDCSSSPTQACYGTGYIQYTLQHDGTNAGILDWNGNSRVFDFGVASVNNGKALAAERYITSPLAAADQALIAQPGIQHIELQGRPLDGVYYLRIWDSPNLNWNNLQDIQIVLDYEYWSEIIANGNAQGQ